MFEFWLSQPYRLSLVVWKVGCKNTRSSVILHPRPKIISEGPTLLLSAKICYWTNYGKIDKKFLHTLQLIFMSNTRKIKLVLVFEVKIYNWNLYENYFYIPWESNLLIFCDKCAAHCNSHILLYGVTFGSLLVTDEQSCSGFWSYPSEERIALWFLCLLILTNGILQAFMTT